MVNRHDITVEHVLLPRNRAFVEYWALCRNEQRGTTRTSPGGGTRISPQPHPSLHQFPPYWKCFFPAAIDARLPDSEFESNGGSEQRRMVYHFAGDRMTYKNCVHSVGSTVFCDTERACSLHLFGQYSCSSIQLVPATPHARIPRSGRIGVYTC